MVSKEKQHKTIDNLHNRLMVELHRQEERNLLLQLKSGS